MKRLLTRPTSAAFAALSRTLGSAHRWPLAVLIAMITGLGMGLPSVHKDTRLDAFIPAGSPALALRQQVEERFGLTEPIAIGYFGKDAGAALTPPVLEEIRAVTALLKAQPGIDPDQVMSLATRSWVAAEGESLNTRLLLPEGPISERTAAEVERGLDAAPAWRGILLSEDGSSAMILAEVRADANPGEVYQAVEKQLAARALPAGMVLHIAGQATISGYLSRYIDGDTRKLVPAAILLSLVLMTVMLRALAALAIGVVILVGTLVGTLGLMGWFGKPMYVITSSLPVVLVCISIADAIHLLVRAGQLRRSGHTPAAAIDAALKELIRPLALTSITTAFGFLGLTLGSSIPAMQQYGLFAAVGVVLAWLLTVYGAPPLYVWLSRSKGPIHEVRFGFIERATGSLARVTGRAPAMLLTLGAGMTVVSLCGLYHLQFNYERVRNFGTTSPVYQANVAINSRFAGSYNLDVLLSGNPGALVEPEVLQRIAGLQEWMRQTGGFQDSVSYLDIIRDTRRAANPEDGGRLPASADDAEQALFLFEASANPGELSQRITADRGQALVRGYLRTDNFQQVAPKIAELERELAQRFGGSAVQAQITGPVYVTNSWVGPLYGNTIAGIAMTMLLVGLSAILVFRSIALGLLCLMPVSMAVLFVFGLMGATGIWLDVVTSMFASICIGLGVDFAIHMLHAINEARREGHAGAALAEVVNQRVGASLAFNALAVGGGMLVTIMSVIPPVGYFGFLTATAVLSAYIATLLTLPPLFVLLSRRPQPLETINFDIRL